jgi:hypothetical protein
MANMDWDERSGALPRRFPGHEALEWSLAQAIHCKLPRHAHRHQLSSLLFTNPHFDPEAVGDGHVETTISDLGKVA